VRRNFRPGPRAWASLGLFLGGLALIGGCGRPPGAVPCKAGAMAGPPRFSVIERADRARNTDLARALATRGCRGIYFRARPGEMERFREIERVGVRVERKPNDAYARFARFPIEPDLKPGSRREISESLAQQLAELSASPDVLVLVTFDHVADSRRYSRVYPALDARLPMIVAVLDLDRLEERRDRTDVGDEMAYVLALVRDYTEFWEQRVRPGEFRTAREFRHAYEENVLRYRRREQRALESESEIRRERYFDYAARVGGPFDDGRSIIPGAGRVPARLRPFALFAGLHAVAAREHQYYHRPWRVRPPGLISTRSTIEVRRGPAATLPMPYVPYTGEGPRPRVITPREYKVRWYDAFRREVAREARKCPYCRSAAPDSARFPDEATPLEWFLRD